MTKASGTGEPLNLADPLGLGSTKQCNEIFCRPAGMLAGFWIHSEDHVVASVALTLLALKSEDRQATVHADWMQKKIK